jgi:hypothetical protein
VGDEIIVLTMDMALLLDMEAAYGDDRAGGRPVMVGDDVMMVSRPRDFRAADVMLDIRLTLAPAEEPINGFVRISRLALANGGSLDDGAPLVDDVADGALLGTRELVLLHRLDVCGGPPLRDGKVAADVGSWRPGSCRPGSRLLDAAMLLWLAAAFKPREDTDMTPFRCFTGGSDELRRFNLGDGLTGCLVGLGSFDTVAAGLEGTERPRVAGVVVTTFSVLAYGCTGCRVGTAPVCLNCSCTGFFSAPTFSVTPRLNASGRDAAGVFGGLVAALVASPCSPSRLMVSSACLIICAHSLDTCTRPLPSTNRDGVMGGISLVSTDVRRLSIGGPAVIKVLANPSTGLCGGTCLEGRSESSRGLIGVVPRCKSSRSAERRC